MYTNMAIQVGIFLLVFFTICHAYSLSSPLIPSLTPAALVFALLFSRQWNSIAILIAFFPSLIVSNQIGRGEVSILPVLQDIISIVLPLIFDIVSLRWFSREAQRKYASKFGTAIAVFAFPVAYTGAWSLVIFVGSSVPGAQMGAGGVESLYSVLLPFNVVLAYFGAPALSFLIAWAASLTAFILNDPLVSFNINDSLSTRHALLLDTSSNPVSVDSSPTSFYLDNNMPRSSVSSNNYRGICSLRGHTVIFVAVIWVFVSWSLLRSVATKTATKPSTVAVAGVLYACDSIQNDLSLVQLSNLTTQLVQQGAKMVVTSELCFVIPVHVVYIIFLQKIHRTGNIFINFINFITGLDVLQNIKQDDDQSISSFEARASEVARQHGVYMIIGVQVGSRLFAVVSGPSGFILRYHKASDTGKLEPGATVSSFVTEWGTVCLVECADMGYFRFVSQTGSLGCGQLVAPFHQWAAITPIDIWRVLPFRAVENGAAVFAVNYDGLTLAVSAFGEPLLQYNSYAAAVRRPYVIAELPTQHYVTMSHWSVVGWVCLFIVLLATAQLLRDLCNTVVTSIE